MPREVVAGQDAAGDFTFSFFLKGRSIDDAGATHDGTLEKQTHQTGTPIGARICIVIATLLSHLNRRRIISLLAGEIRWPIK